MHLPCLEAKNKLRTRKLSRGFRWVAVLIAACLCPTLAFGQTNSSWNGGTGNWSNATDWTPSQVPNNGGGNTYNVTIDSSDSTTAYVYFDQSATINSLVLGGAISFGKMEQWRHSISPTDSHSMLGDRLFSEIKMILRWEAI